MLGQAWGVPPYRSHYLTLSLPNLVHRANPTVSPLKRVHSILKDPLRRPDPCANLHVPNVQPFPPNFDCYTDRITTACAPVESTRGSNKSRQVRRACLCMNQVRSSATAQRGTERGRVLQRGASADLRSSEAHSCPSVSSCEFGYCIWSHLPPDPGLGSVHGARLCMVMNMWERPKET